MTRDPRRRNFDEVFASARMIVNTWDPARLLYLGAPVDEYDDLVMTLTGQLSTGATPGIAAAVVEAALVERYEMTPTSPHRLTELISMTTLLN